MKAVIVVFINSRMIQYYRQMMPSNRLKLGPKRKDSNIFQRLHKLHSHHQSENVQQPKIQSSIPSSRPPEISPALQHQMERNTYVKQPPCAQSWLQQTKTNPIASNLLKLAEIGVLTQRINQRQGSERDQLFQKCMQLEIQPKQLQKENEANRLKNQENQNREQQLSNNSKELEQQLRFITAHNQQLQQQVMNLKVEVSSFDLNYYEQQIKRLRTQCEDLQIQKLQQTHRLQKSEQNTKEAEQQLKKKQQEIKTLQKYVQKQKLGLAESKAQSSSKDSCFRLALEESEAANQVLCRSLEETTRQLRREEQLRKEKESIIVGLQAQIQALLVRSKDAEAKYLHARKSNEQQLNEMAKRIFAMQKQEESKNKESEITINRLSADLNALKTQHAKNLAAAHQDSQSRQTETIVESELRIVRLQQEVRQLSEKEKGKDNVVTCLEAKLKHYFSPDQYSALERRCKQLQEKRLNSARYYEQKLYGYQKENEKLRLEKTVIIPQDCKQNMSFDELLRKTLEESQCLREELKRMSEVLGTLKDQAAQVRQREKGYLNQLQILRKKNETSSKNFEIELQVERQKLQNESQSLRRKLSTVETRLDCKIKENRQKDEFIKSFLINRSQLHERQTLLCELERIFSQRCELTE